MKFCSHCASAIIRKIPENDHLPRDVCSQCDTVFYTNPLVITGCIVEQGEQILLCKRDIEPRLGYWTIPGGFMENNETTMQGAARETMEESQADVNIERLHGVYNIPRVNQVYFIYIGTMKTPHFGTTPESSEVALFNIEDIPWDDIAFRVIKKSLSHYLKVRSGTGPVEVHQLTIE